MAKLVKLDKHYYPRGGLGHWCPGCNSGHEIAVDAANHSGARWTFDGNAERPTFSPSINIRVNTPDMKGYQPDHPSSVCHYFIRDGRIQFLGDCTHALKGQTVDLPEIPDGKYLTSERL